MNQEHSRSQEREVKSLRYDRGMQDDDEVPDPIEILREAFTTLDGKHPELVAKIAQAMQSSRGQDSQLPAVEAAFREAAVSLVPVDKDAAETLFTIAEVLAQIPRYKLTK